MLVVGGWKEKSQKSYHGYLKTSYSNAPYSMLPDKIIIMIEMLLKF